MHYHNRVLEPYFTLTKSASKGRVTFTFINRVTCPISRWDINKLHHKQRQTTNNERSSLYLVDSDTML